MGAKVSRRGWGDRPWLTMYWQDDDLVGSARYRDPAAAYTAARRWRDGNDEPMDKREG